jgi:site-specific DNA-methyltransferase (adenine-specific)
MIYNKIYQEDCLSTMAGMPDNFVHLVITSPPYDNLRNYNGYSFDFEKIAKELFRILKEGGIVVWIVNDGTINGSETGTSFKQALFFKECGFNLHDTMIWRKPNPMPHIKQTLYTPSFEYMFIFSKGKPRTVNLITEPTKYGGKILKTYTSNPESIRKPNIEKPTKYFKPLQNVWDIKVFGTNYGHPAIFPEELAQRHILTWSNKDDLIYDPMCGSGTTLKMAKLNNRNWIGSEISKEYAEIANKRLAQKVLF